MTNFNADPAAEIAYLKALEKANQPAWPDAMPPADPAKLKKKTSNWPDTMPPAKAKKDLLRLRPRVSPELYHYRTTHYQGYTLAEVGRVLLLLAIVLAAAVYFD